MCIVSSIFLKMMIFSALSTEASSSILYDKCLSNVGKEFLVMILDCGRYNIPLKLHIVTPIENSIVNVNIRTPLTDSLDVNEIVTYGSETTVNVPLDVVTVGTTRSNQSILVTANNFIVLYASNIQYNTAESFIIHPIRSFGTRYVSANQGTKPPAVLEKVITVASVTDNTIVNITVPDGIEFKFEGKNCSHHEICTVAINRYEAFQISISNNLAGTLVSSSHPIAVFSGNDMNVPQIGDDSTSDLEYEMLLPVKYWSTVYYVVTNPIFGSNDGEIVTVYSYYDSTNIIINIMGIKTTETLSGGAYHRFSLFEKQSGYIVSDYPVQVTQEQSAGPLYFSLSGDAYLLLTTPFDSWMNDYSFTTPGRSLKGSLYHGMVILAHVSTIDTILLDNAAISPTRPWRNISDTDIVYTSIRLTRGFHRLTCIAGNFRCWGYLFGFQSIEGYGTAVGRILQENQLDQDSSLGEKPVSLSMTKNSVSGKPVTDPLISEVSVSLLGCCMMCDLYKCHVFAYDVSTKTCSLYSYAGVCDTIQETSDSLYLLSR